MLLNSFSFINYAGCTKKKFNSIPSYRTIGK